MVTVDDLREIATSLPGAFERASYGDRPSWRTPARMFAWLRDDPEALVVWVDSVEERDAMIADEPGLFFTTPHYDGQPIVLADPEQLDRATAVELITESFRLRAERRLVARLDAGLDAR